MIGVLTATLDQQVLDEWPTSSLPMLSVLHRWVVCVPDHTSPGGAIHPGASLARSAGTQGAATNGDKSTGISTHPARLDFLRFSAQIGSGGDLGFLYPCPQFHLFGII